MSFIMRFLESNFVADSNSLEAFVHATEDIRLRGGQYPTTLAVGSIHVTLVFARAHSVRT